MSRYLEWFEGEDQISESEEEEDYHDEELSQYIYDSSNYNNNTNEDDGVGETLLQIAKSEKELAQKPKKKKKKKKKVHTEHDEQLNKMVINPHEDAFMRRMAEEAEEKLLKSREEMKQQLAKLSRIDFVAQFKQCFKTHLVKYATNKLGDGIDIGRKHATATSEGGMVYLFGGRSDHSQFNNILAFDTDANVWHRLPLETSSSIPFPLLAQPFMFPIASDLLIYDNADRFYVLHSALRYLNERKKENMSKLTVLWNGMSAGLTIGQAQGYAACVFRNEVYVFGGTENQVSSDRLLKFTIYHDHAQYRVEGRVMTVPHNLKAFVPPPRSHHGCVAIGQNVYIFGGIFESHLHSIASAKRILYNDIHRYDTINNRWSEVRCTGVSPPPMYGFSMNGCHNFIYVYGGILADNSIQSNLYRFDIAAGSWSVILIRGPSLPVTVSPTEYQTPSAFHAATFVHDKKMVVIGGVHDTPTANKEVYKKRVFCIESITEQGEEKHLTEYLWKCLQKNRYSDIHLRCAKRENGEEEFITAHKAILAIRSPYFEKLLEDFEAEDFREDGTPILEIADFYSDTVLSFLSFVYQGQVRVNGSQQIKDLMRCAEAWGHSKEIEQICALSTDLDLSARVMIQLAADFERLYNESIEVVSNSMVPDLNEYDLLAEKSTEGHKRYTDVCMQLLDVDDNVVLKATGHKVLLCRSSHMHNAFNSGMEESISGNIQFTNFTDLEGLMGVIKFLYTDEIKVTPEVALEILLASQIFVLPQLASYCCAVIMENVNKENVLQVLDIADTYNHSELKRSCLNLFMRHFQELIKEEGYSQLSIELRKELELNLIPNQIKHEMRKKKREQMKLLRDRKKK